VNDGALTRASWRPVRNAALIIGIAAAVGSVIVIVTGGFVGHIGSIRVSARSPRNPAVIAAVCGCLAVALSTRDERRRVMSRFDAAVTAALRRSRAIGAATALLIAGGAFVIGAVYGAFEAGGSDSFGYVSEAELWTNGTLAVELPLMKDPTWRRPIELLTPLAYRPSPVDPHAIMPVYPPGLPLTMAVFQGIGGRPAVFYVVPLLAALTVWSTYLMGARLADRYVGILAALSMAAAPIFIFQTVAAPMTDVPIAAWWALGLALLTFTHPLAALASGLACAMAILTKPNLVPLAAVPGLWLLADAIRSRSLKGNETLRLLLFGLASASGAVAVAVINARLYGSPWESGYGDISGLYGWSYWLENIRNYWVRLTTQTPLALIGLVAPILVARRTAPEVRRRVFMWWTFVLAVLASYLFYAPFEGWAYVRFILPAFPPLLVLTAFGLVRVSDLLPGRWGRPAAGLIVLLVGFSELEYTRKAGTFRTKETESRYSAAGHYVARNLPENAALFSMQQSGSVRYYSGRLSVRYDGIPFGDLEAVIRELRSHGYRPYFLLEEWEEEVFRQIFAKRTPLGSLDWPPKATVGPHGVVRIYDPADREARADGPAAR
jgi:hypothetical protein